MVEREVIMKQHTMIGQFINKRIREGKKNIVLKFYKLTEEKRKLCKDIINFLDEKNYSNRLPWSKPSTIRPLPGGRSARWIAYT